MHRYEQTMNPAEVRARWAVLSLNHSAILRQAEELGAKVRAEVQVALGARYLVRLEILEPVPGERVPSALEDGEAPAVGGPEWKAACELSAEELEALAEWARLHGRTWKSKLGQAWERADYRGFKHGPTLQQIRNARGLGGSTGST